MKLRTKLSILIFSSLGAAMGCSDDAPPPRSSSQAATTDTLGEIEEEDSAPEVAYAYSPVGKRDPFRSLFDEIRSTQKPGDETELQRYDIDQLRLIAIVTGRATPYAMVEDPAAKGHTLTRGTLIGRNWGRISAIDPNCVTIKEEYRDYTGRKHANEIDMCLPKPPALKFD